MTGEQGPDPARTGTLLPSGQELSAALEDRIAAALGRPVTVQSLVRMTGGASRETWSFDSVTADGYVRPLILRRCAPDARNASMVLEAAASSAAGARGVPVPVVVFADDGATDLGGPSLVAGRIEGETVARRIFRLLDATSTAVTSTAVTSAAVTGTAVAGTAVAGTKAVGRLELAQQCATALARLHRVDPGEVAGLPPAQDPVDARRMTIDEFGVASPAFELALRWLDDHRPEPGRPTVVHGDFRVGNLIVGADGLRAVLDWELVHAGDPIEDIGWFCSRAWRFGEDHLEAGGMATIEAFVATYEAQAGSTVDRAALEWWVTLANLSWGVSCIIQSSRHLSGAEPSVELAAIGRRIPETEWDLMECLRRAGWPG